MATPSYVAVTVPRATLRNRRGIIVLGPLLVFVVILVIMVLGGKLLYPKPRGTYLIRPEPELSYVVSPAEVYSRGRVVLRLSPGDSVWIVRLDNGSAAVFRDASGREVIGVANDLLATDAGKAKSRLPAGGGSPAGPPTVAALRD